MRHLDKPITDTSASRTAAMPVHQDVFDALADLDAALRRRYGCDFAYTVMGHGSILAASNYVHGVVTPRTDGGAF